MRSILQRIPPEWPVRVGLAAVNTYARYYLITDPQRYYRYIPDWFATLTGEVLAFDAYLRIQGVIELGIAALLLAWFISPSWVRAGAAAFTVEMSPILALTGIGAATFRNLGLLGGGITLLLVISNQQRNDSLPRACGSDCSPCACTPS